MKKHLHKMHQRKVKRKHKTLTPKRARLNGAELRAFTVTDDGVGGLSKLGMDLLSYRQKVMRQRRMARKKARGYA